MGILDVIRSLDRRILERRCVDLEKRCTDLYEENVMLRAQVKQTFAKTVVMRTNEGDAKIERLQKRIVNLKAALTRILKQYANSWAGHEEQATARTVTAVLEDDSLEKDES